MGHWVPVHLHRHRYLEASSNSYLVGCLRRCIRPGSFVSLPPYIQLQQRSIIPRPDQTMICVGIGYPQPALRLPNLLASDLPDPFPTEAKFRANIPQLPLMDYYLRENGVIPCCNSVWRSHQKGISSLVGALRLNWSCCSGDADCCCPRLSSICISRTLISVMYCFCPSLSHDRVFNCPSR